MKIQSSEPVYIPAITMDRTTGKLEMGKINWTEAMERARLTRDAELRDLAFAKKSLSPQEVRALAEKLYKKYDPQNMTESEYDRFISDLVNGGALVRAEANYMGGRYGVTVDPSAPGGLVEVDSSAGAIQSLSKANGNALLYLRAMQNWYGGSRLADETRANAIQKAAAVLDAILKRRAEDRASWYSAVL